MDKRLHTNYEAQEEIFAVIEQNPGKPEVCWPLIVEFVADWLMDEPHEPHTVSPRQLAQDWREEMS